MDESRFRCLVTPLLEAAWAICCWPPPGLAGQIALSKGQRADGGSVGLTKVRQLAGRGIAPLCCEAVMWGSEMWLASQLELTMGAWLGCMAGQAFLKVQAAGVARRSLAGSSLLIAEEHEALLGAELSIPANWGEVCWPWHCLAIFHVVVDVWPSWSV